jgi:hypothetical protein
MMADYLRAQARTCSQWARECFDLGTAARLRSMADEFKAKAAEVEATTSTFEIALEHPASPRRATALEIGGDAP